MRHRHKFFLEGNLVTFEHGHRLRYESEWHRHDIDKQQAYPSPVRKPKVRILRRAADA